MRDNIILRTDSYKLSHWQQYPPGTTSVFSYFENRTGGQFPYTVFFGLQALIAKHLLGQVVTEEKIQEAKDLAEGHVGQFNEAGWRHILEAHDGRLPIRIRAVPEGMLVPESNVLMTIENTDPHAYWLTNYLETLLVQAWYPTTVATLSHQVRRILLAALEKTGDPSLLPFKLHDFGFRGVSSVESAGMGGMAHLVNFMGTDTIEAVRYAQHYYDADMPGVSIPASEHSTITSWGAEGELAAMRNMLQQYPTGLVACVSDSFDIDRACTEYWGGELKDEVLRRDGVLVVRPDSGDIVPMVMNVLRRLGNAFGTYHNANGYRILNDKVRVIQGDGCTIDTIDAVVRKMIEEGWSIDNIAFGMGGGLLQKVDRDTQKFAFKCSSVTVEGEEVDVYKQPKSDPRKNSKRGRLELLKDRSGRFYTAREGVAQESGDQSMMSTVFENGSFVKRYSFEEIREKVAREDVFRA